MHCISWQMQGAKVGPQIEANQPFKLQCQYTKEISMLESPFNKSRFDFDKHEYPWRVFSFKFCFIYFLSHPKISVHT